MADADAATILKSINDNISKIGFWPLPLLGLIAFTPLLGAPAPYPLITVVLAAMLAALSYWIYRRDTMRFTTVLLYDLDDAVIKVFEKLAAEFDDLSQTQKVMNIETKGVVYDWKRHAGAAFEVKSNSAHFVYGTPIRIRTNISVPFISGE